MLLFKKGNVPLFRLSIFIKDKINSFLFNPEIKATKISGARLDHN